MHGAPTLVVALVLLATAAGSPQICLTGSGRAGGGVANTVAFANALLDFALQHNYTFLPPALQVTAHRDSTANAAVARIVGPPMALDEDAPRAQRLRCPHQESRCRLAAMVVDFRGTVCTVSNRTAITALLLPAVSPSTSDACAVVLVAPLRTMAWHFDYSRTRSYFQHNWLHPAAQPSPSPDLGPAGPAAAPLGTQLQVAIHFRLGDVAALRHEPAGRNVAEKRMAPAWAALGLGLVLAAVRSACVQARLVTDGSAAQASETLQSVRALLGQLGPGADLAIEVDASNAKGVAGATSLQALHTLATASVLVASASGFARLAAVVSPNIVVAPELHSHPLPFSNVVTVPAQPALWQWWQPPNSVNMQGMLLSAASVAAALRAMLLYTHNHSLPAACWVP